MMTSGFTTLHLVPRVRPGVAVARFQRRTPKRCTRKKCHVCSIYFSKKKVIFWQLLGLFEMYRGNKDKVLFYKNQRTVANE